MSVCKDAWLCVYRGVEWMCVQVCVGECTGMLGCVCRGAWLLYVCTWGLSGCVCLGASVHGG